MYKYILVILTIITQFIHAQDTPWSRINTGNSALPNETVKCIVFDSEGAMWVGTYMGGLAVNKDSVWTVYNTSNSELPHNYINSIAIDKNDVKWIGTDGGGLARFDGTTWQVFKTSNSGLPSNVVMSVYSDKNGILWVGTYFGGLARFDGQNWTIFNDENSPLLSNKVVALVIDTNNLVWVGTQGGGLGSYDGSNWTIYTERSSKLTSDYIYSIAIDGENNKWVGTGGGGVAVFNDAYWLNFNSKNSKIGDDNIRPILVDDQGDKWIGTYIGGLNKFDGEEWKVFNYQNSSMPDDEVTCLAYKSPNLFLGTERSGIVSFQVTQKPKDTDLEEDITTVVTPAVVFDDKTYEAQPEEQVNPVEEPSKIFTAKTRNKIVLLFDAADVYFDKARLTMYRRSFKLLLKNRERINDTYDVTLMIYSSNYDLNPKKIQFTEGDLKALRVKNVIYLEGETQFTEAVKKAFNNVSDEYNSIGDNHVIAATYKFINDDETAKIVIKENSDKYNIVFSLLAYETSAWKMEYKMKDLVPKGDNYYSINHASIKDNWSVTGQIGLSLFRGDLDVNSMVTFPGVFGFAVNKQVLSTGIINGGIKGQFNFGKLQGTKNGYSFENKYKEGCLNFQVILNTWVNRNFRFEKVRPYAFAGIGFINYRVLLRDPNGNVENGYGYKVTQGDVEGNGQNPEKDQAVTDLMIPLGVGLNYKLNEKINLEIEASSRFINSDRLDGRVKDDNDKYWFVSVGITYMFSNKEFLADILNR
jgi:streptogramin lyase